MRDQTLIPLHVGSWRINDLEFISSSAKNFEGLDYLISWSAFASRYKTKIYKWPSLPSGKIPLRVRYILRLLATTRLPKVSLVGCTIQTMRRAVIELYLRCFTCGCWIPDDNVILSEDIVKETRCDLEGQEPITTSLSVHIKIKTRPWCYICPGCHKDHRLIPHGEVYVRHELLLLNSY